MKQLHSLWRGDKPLGEAFWTWGLLWALVINLSTTVAFLVLISGGQPVLALVVGYAVSVPYNIVALVGIWRSAARHAGPPLEAGLARWASLILLTVLSLT